MVHLIAGSQVGVGSQRQLAAKTCVAAASTIRLVKINIFEKSKKMKSYRKVLRMILYKAKRFPKHTAMRSDVDIDLASVYYYCFRATKSVLRRRAAVCC